MIRFVSCLLGCSALTLVAAAPAGAQSAPEARADAPGVADIVVTAQRRAERAQDVPVVVTAFSPERLRQLNVTQPQDLYGNVPSLVSGTQGQAVRDVQSYSIRGQSTGFLASPGVALYLNEVPLPASISLNLQGAPGNFLDLENVQVLSGPQGTLFGRNTTGGAVLFGPRKPTDKFGGYVEGGVGNYNLRSLEGVVNIPIAGDVLAIRVAGAYQDRRGYTKDLVWDKWRDDTHYYTGRVGIMFRPSDRFENYTMFYGTRSSNNGSGNIINSFNIPGLQGVGFCVDPPTAPPGPSGIAVSCDVYRQQVAIQKQIGPRKMRGNDDGFSKIRSFGVINTTAINLSDELTLRNIASLQRLKDNYSVDQDGTPIQQFELVQSARQPDFPIPGLSEYGLPIGGVYTNSNRNFKFPRDSIEQITEELQLQGRMLDNHLNFTVGAFYFDAHPDQLWGSRTIVYCPAAFTGLCTPSETRSGVSNLSKAAYGQFTLDLGAFSPSLENLRVTGGYRYTWDRIDGFNRSWAPQPGGTTVKCNIGGITPATIPISDIDRCTFSAQLKSSAPTWTLGLDYRPVKNLLLYAKASRGYKSGGFNSTAVRAETRIFQPEKLTTYEAGFKSDWRFGDVPVRLNATYYHSDYSNIQRPGSDFNPSTGLVGAQILAASARIQGVEAEVSIRPVRGVEIGGNMSYTDAKYKKYLAPVFTAPVASCNGVVNPSPTPGTTAFADFSCTPFQFVTPWIYSVHASVDLPIPSDLGALTLYATYNHVSSQYTAPGYQEPGARLKGYGLVNGSLSWKGIGGSGFDATLFVTNLTNKLYRVSNSNSYSGLLIETGLYGEPRMFGLKVRYAFGEK